MIISITTRDITTLAVDAIVNAANESLLVGGGVDGAIHRAAGSELLDHCRTLGGCPTGEARLTPGFNLKAPHVIHCVGPIWRGGTQREAQQLRACYIQCLALTAAETIRSIAFPAISTGVYGFPKADAAEIAVGTVTDWLAANTHSLTDILFCCFDPETTQLYTALLNA